MKPEVLLNQFLDSDYFYPYDLYLTDPAALSPVLISLLEGAAESGKLPNELARTELLDFFYLHFLPAEALVFPDEIICLHEHLIDFYHFLNDHDYLSKANYNKILHYFQNNKQLFLERMMDDDCWSASKKRELLDNESNVLSQMSETLKLLKKDLEKQTTKNNVVPFAKKQSPLQSDAYQLRIDLDGFRPPIWRRILVPKNFNLHQLHLIIQILFGWENSHLHQFFRGNGNQSFQPAEQLIGQSAEDYGFARFKATQEVTLEAIFTQTKTLKYVYDFGADWMHTIKVEKLIPAEQVSSVTEEPLPVCIKGKQDAPQEDALGADFYTPFHLAEINQQLQKIRK